MSNPEPAKIDSAELREAVELIHWASLAWLTMEKIGTSDGKDGSGRLHTCACRCVKHDLLDDVAVLVIRLYAVNNPFPRDWTDEEILQRMRDAEGKATRGKAVGGDKPRLAKVAPKRVADELIASMFTLDGQRTLLSRNRDLFEWTGDHYGRLTLSDSKSVIRRRCKGKYSNHTRNAIASVLDAMIAETLLPPDFHVP